MKQVVMSIESSSMVIFPIRYYRCLSFAPPFNAIETKEMPPKTNSEYRWIPFNMSIIFQCLLFVCLGMQRLWKWTCLQRASRSECLVRSAALRRPSILKFSWSSTTTATGKGVCLVALKASHCPSFDCRSRPHCRLATPLWLVTVSPTGFQCRPFLFLDCTGCTTATTLRSRNISSPSGMESTSATSC